MRYYFHVRGAVEFVDKDGCELATPDDAYLQAVRSAGEYLRDDPEAMLEGQDLRIEVDDPGGHLVFAFTAAGRRQ